MSALKYTPGEIREMIHGLDTPVRGNSPAVNLDNAATTPAFKGVIAEIQEKLLMYGSIGRGAGQKSEYSSGIYEKGRGAVKQFFGIDPDDETYTVIYTNNTTDGINKLASALIDDQNGDISVICTRMEHHANDLPWRERLGNDRIFYVETDEKGRLEIDGIERLLSKNRGIKYVCVTAASNVTGYVNDVRAIAKTAHSYGAKIIVDGAQIAAHRKFDIPGNSPGEDIDFFVFSAHKMYSPFGGGAIIGRSDILNRHKPAFYGGGMVDSVYDFNVDYSPPPDLYEAGSPNYPGVVGMLKAMEILNDIGFDYICEHERKLMARTIAGLKNISGARLYGDNDSYSDRVGIVVFNIGGFSDSYVAEALARENAIAVRHRKFCAHTYVSRLLKNGGYSQDGMVRVSFGVYTNEQEIDIFLETAQKIAAGKTAGVFGVTGTENRTAPFAKPGVRLPNDRG
ncbi:MAG: aminotransferase class V-fold PLP-dependent enzyme [Oscillospiraceae bacterium]|nr:aminotransferase class V-fold PLP-dependent enzyme [Oscillospiraceae bacterium]